MVLTAFMKRCKFCQGRVSLNADSCPHCGASLTPLSNLLISLGLVLLAALCVWMITKGAFLSSGPAPGNLPLAQSRLPQECTYLSRLNLPTSGYKPAHGGLYQCVSQVRYFGKEKTYTLHYQASGTPTRVQSLALHLKVHNPKNLLDAHNTLMQYGSTLSVHTLNSPLPGAVAKAIQAGTAGHWRQDDCYISVQRTELPEGYMLSLQLEPNAS